jgi:hypothetical protein
MVRVNTDYTRAARPLFGVAYRRRDNGRARHAPGASSD